MKKIMFNDKYGLEKAVLEGRKTQTRRNATFSSNAISIAGPYPQIVDENGVWHHYAYFASYEVGEIVAIAQKYKDIPSLSEQKMFCGHKGWGNKMFVKATDMPHHIKITNIRVEKLQDISDGDCIAEGITITKSDDFWFPGCKDDTLVFPTARDAYATLIDKVGKKGTWAKNDWVFVYEFELVD